MKLVIAAVVVTVIALVGSRVSFFRLSFGRIRLLSGVENLLLTGTEYILVGLLLGSAGLDLLDRPTLHGLYPIMGLGLSWIGMLFGVQWEFRRVAQIPRRMFGIALLQAVVTLAVVVVPFYFLFRQFVYEAGFVLIGAMTLAAAASGTAQSGLALVARNAPPESRPLMNVLQHVAQLDSLVGVAAFGLISCLAVLHDGTPAYYWIGASVGLGLVGGLLIAGLAAHRLSDDDLLLVVLGAVAFGGGLALHLHLSPLLINLIAGMVIANLARERARTGIRNVLLRGERSIYILFLVVVGADWALGSPWVLALVLVYLVTRTLGKMLGGYLSARCLVPETPAFRPMGLGLVSHGGMAVAIVVNLHQIHRSDLTDVVTSVVLLGMLISEIVSPTLLRRLLGRTQ